MVLQELISYPSYKLSIIYKYVIKFKMLITHVDQKLSSVKYPLDFSCYLKMNEISPIKYPVDTQTHYIFMCFQTSRLTWKPIKRV